MKIARFRTGGRVVYGVVKGDQVSEITGGIYTRFRMTDMRHLLSKVKLLPPTRPSQIWGPGPNFPGGPDFLQWAGGDEVAPKPVHLEPWIKSRNSLTGTDDPIIIPKDSSGDVHYQGEIVAVIGKECRRVTPAQASRFILGYTCGNDVSDRGWQKNDRTAWRAKGADTFAPVGPWIETGLEPQKLEVTVRVNGQEAQRLFTGQMLLTFQEIISYISQQVTLRPGDLVFSGSAGPTHPLKPGDVVEVSTPPIGVLRNPVVAEFDSSRDLEVGAPTENLKV